MSHHIDQIVFYLRDERDGVHCAKIVGLIYREEDYYNRMELLQVKLSDGTIKTPDELHDSLLSATKALKPEWY